MNKIKTTTICIESKYNDLILKGELEFWSKEYTVTLKDPLYAQSFGHISYIVPAVYVIRKSKNPCCIEIELLEKSKEILVELYLEHKKSD